MEYCHIENVQVKNVSVLLEKEEQHYRIVKFIDSNVTLGFACTQYCYENQLKNIRKEIY